MGKKTTEEIITALRCISREPEEWDECTGCPYYLEETWNGETITGCNCDQIDRDAADRLEELSKNATEISVHGSPAGGSGEIHGGDGGERL